MLVPFAIDHEGLAPDRDWTLAQQQACYESLVEAWLHIGLLVHDGESYSTSRVRAAIEALPPKLKYIVQALVGRLPILSPAVPWSGDISMSSSALGQLAAVAAVALIDDTKAEAEFGFDDSELSRKFPAYNGVEICRLLGAANSYAFKEARLKAGTHILPGQSYVELWAERFCILARAPIKQISIVDRYTISQHFKCPQGRLSGIERFIRQLNSDASGPRYLTIYSAWTPELQALDVKLEAVRQRTEAIISHLSSNKVKKVTVLMLPNAAFGNLHHDRYVRFEEYVWDIGLGLQVFEGPAVESKSAASLKSGLQVVSYKETEQELNEHDQATAFRIKF